jgi:membrane glycosyltransferase
MNLRSTLREERHPNAVTAPPIHRGSMVPRPWRGFWNSVGTALLSTASDWLPPYGQRPARAEPAREPWQSAANRRRAVFAALTLAWTVMAAMMFSHLQPETGNPWLQAGQLVLFVTLSAWVLTGFVTALMGFWVSLFGDQHTLRAADVRGHAMNPEARTAIIMPICNEDVATVFAGLRATCDSLAATGEAQVFDVFVLSDSHDPAIQRAERAAWENLRSELATQNGRASVEVYYRLRTRRTHRKAGNVADFCRRWGRDYRYMVVLDADSVMSGNCLVDMVKLMEAHPRAGIIQTATQAVGHATLHAQNARLMAEPGIHRVHRSMFAIGAMSYLSAPLWLAFLAFGTALWVTDQTVVPTWDAVPTQLRGLWVWTLCLLFMPRVLGLVAVFLKREQRQFGGGRTLVMSAVIETGLALLQAPIRMLAHSLFVLVALTGLKLDWKSPPREANGIGWADAAQRLAPMSVVIGLMGVGVSLLNANALLWLAPVALPLLLAVPLTVATSHVDLGAWMRSRGVLLIPEESWSPAVLRSAWRHASRLALKAA